MKHSFVYTSVSILAGLAYLLGATEDAAPYSLAVVSVMLLAYISYEIYRFAAAEGYSRLILMPPVLTTLFMFGLRYGVANISLYTRHGQWWMDHLKVDYAWATRATALALLGVVWVWVGYRSRFGPWASDRLSSFFRFDVLISRSWELRWSVVWVFVISSLVARLILIELGIYGFAGGDLNYETTGYTEILNNATQLGKLALFALALHCAGSKGASIGATFAMCGVMLYDMFFGIIGSWKGQVMFPPLLIGLCYYMVRGRIPALLLVVCVFSVPLAYKTVEPIRDGWRYDPYFDNSSVQSITLYLLDSLANNQSEEDKDETDKDDDSTSIRFMERNNYTIMFAAAIRYKETVGMQDDDPPLLANLLLFNPLFTMIPRFLWPDKPYTDMGFWFTEAVLGQWGIRTSQTPGLVGHLYLASGWLGICVGCSVLGILLRVFHVSFWKPGACGFLFLYLISVGLIASQGGAFDHVITFLIRYLPLLVICQYLLFKRS